ncbi:MAG: hypothetical protein IJJ13_01890, partial [Lachnospiraceae bacterium]|nr:hypothetical protein [Lachnospiraceae bacterium]
PSGRGGTCLRHPWLRLADTEATAKRIQAPHEMFAYIFMQPATPERKVLPAEGRRLLNCRMMKIVGRDKLSEFSDDI